MSIYIIWFALISPQFSVNPAYFSVDIMLSLWPIKEKPQMSKLRLMMRCLSILAVWRRISLQISYLTDKLHLSNENPCVFWPWTLHWPVPEWLRKAGRNIYKPNLQKTKVKETHWCHILVKVTLLPRRGCHVRHVFQFERKTRLAYEETLEQSLIGIFLHFSAPSTCWHFWLCSLSIILQYWPPEK